MKSESIKGGVDNMNLEEALAASEVSTYSNEEDSKIIINNNLRTMTIPSDLILGVESDENINKLNFQMPRFYCGTDLSEFNIYVNYTNGRTKDAYIVFNQTVNEDSIDFTWIVSRTAVATKGTTKFIVCLKKSDDSGNIVKEYNTTVHELTVLEGLETVSQDISEYSDTIEQLLSQIDSVNKKAEEILGTANKVVEENTDKITSAGNKEIQTIQEESERQVEAIRQEKYISDTITEKKYSFTIQNGVPILTEL